MHDGRNDRRLSSKRHKGISIVLFRRASCGFELAHAHQLHLSSERLASVFINTAQLYRENNAKNNANGSFWKTSPNKSFRFKDNREVRRIRPPYSFTNQLRFVCDCDSSMIFAVLKRLFEYSNIFEQGFENEYSNTKIENRVFEKAMNRAPSPTAASRQPRRWGPPRRHHLIKPLIMNENCARCTIDRVVTHESIPFDRSRFLRSPPAVQCTTGHVGSASRR